MFYNHIHYIIYLLPKGSRNGLRKALGIAAESSLLLNFLVNNVFQEDDETTMIYLQGHNPSQVTCSSSERCVFKSCAFCMYWYLDYVPVGRYLLLLI